MQKDKPVMTYNPKKILNIDVELGDRFSVLEKIGQGSFGDIYKVFDKLKNQLGAVKLERKDKKGPLGMLVKEAKILSELCDSEYFPKLIESSQHQNYNFLIMQYLGPNLENLKRKQGGYMSLKTVLLIAIQMIQNLENLHTLHYIHRDIKPENFVIGTEGNHHYVYLIDFGLSKKYIDEKGDHIPFSENKGLVGTARYTSINSHLGTEQSRRDDLESLGYILLYFVKGFLPWQNFQCETRNEKFRKILETKVATPLDELCQGLPQEFIKYFKHIRDLKFTEKPDYEYLKNMFRQSINTLFGEIPEKKQSSTSNGSQLNLGTSNSNNSLPKKLCFDWCMQQCPLSNINCLHRSNSSPINKNQTKNNHLQNIQQIQQQNQANPLEITDFIDIDERKNGDNQINLPYINKTYPLKMSMMNQSNIDYQSSNNNNNGANLFNSFSAGQKSTYLLSNQKNNNNNNSSLMLNNGGTGNLQYNNNNNMVNSDSRQVFYGDQSNTKNILSSRFQNNQQQQQQQQTKQELMIESKNLQNAKVLSIQQSNIISNSNMLQYNNSSNNNTGVNGLTNKKQLQQKQQQQQQQSNINNNNKNNTQQLSNDYQDGQDENANIQQLIQTPSKLDTINKSTYVVNNSNNNNNGQNFGNNDHNLIGVGEQHKEDSQQSQD